MNKFHKAVVRNKMLNTFYERLLVTALAFGGTVDAKRSSYP